VAAATDRPLVVVLRPLGLGDLLTAVPALRALADAFPGHRRVMAAPRVLEPLALLTGALDAVVDTAPLRPLSPELRGADVAVDLHGKGPASHHVLLASRPRRLIAFANPDVPSTAGLPRWQENEHEVHRWCRLLEGCGIPADPSRLDLDPPPLEPPAEARGATVVHPGAAFPARRWPPERWAAVIHHELAAGRPVVVTGGPSEEALAQDVAERAGLGPQAVLAGRTGLGELAAVVAAADRVVSADTGVAHLATALRTPSVVLFGPEPPTRWGPPSDRPWHRVLWAGRRGDPRGARPDPGLLALGVDDVVAALDALPHAPVSPAGASGSRRSTR
jgi:ADP-heptose:LPS heptosyltransferase